MKSFKYTSYLLKRKCLREYMEAVNFHFDQKEVSECLGMVKVVKEVMRGQEITTAFDIGCGRRPTLGILLLLEVKSIDQAICIDPQLNINLAKNIKGLHPNGCTLSDWCDNNFGPLGGYKNALICCNHSHVEKRELQRLFKRCNNYTYITNPCCIDNKLEKGLYFKDKHINSPNNEIFVFKKEG